MLVFLMMFFAQKYKIFHPFSSYVEEIARERKDEDSFLVKESLFSFQELLPGWLMVFWVLKGYLRDNSTLHWWNVE